MKTNDLKHSIGNIKMPPDMKQRIIKNCYNETEKANMKTNKTLFYKKPIVAIAALVLCICVASTVALASTGKLQGYFKDIKNLGGAITGTAYDQATDEIEIDITKITDVLTVEVTFLNNEQPPYNCSEMLGINSYSIIDSNNIAVVKKKSSELSEVLDGKAQLTIPINELKSGNYTLLVNEFVSEKKADQPLIISGNWELKFTK